MGYVDSNMEHHIANGFDTQQLQLANKVESWNHVEPRKGVLEDFSGKNLLRLEMHWGLESQAHLIMHLVIFGHLE